MEAVNLSPGYQFDYHSCSQSGDFVYKTWHHKFSTERLFSLYRTASRPMNMEKVIK